jgi:hypothetical protein
MGGSATAVGVIARLAHRITEGDAPLGAIADALTDLATSADAARVVVAVDDAALGRQVFTSARAPLGDTPIGLFGPPGAWTEPPNRLETDEADLVAATVGVALAALRADAARPVPVANDGPELALAGAVARARDHGWAFALALVRFDDDVRSAERIAALQSGLRAGDNAFAAGRGTVAVVLPAVRDDEAAAILAAAVRARGLPRCTFGFAHCPGDADDADRLLGLAARRLDEAIAARDPQGDPSNRSG